LRIAVDPIFPPPLEWSKSKKYMIPDETIENCKYELIFDSGIHGNKLEEFDDEEGY
jgi:hypothetical protein